MLATALRLAGWLTLNALASLGAPLALAFAIGSFSISGTLHHVLNLTGRYVAAEPGRQDQFDAILVWIILGCFAGTGFFRRHSLKLLLLQETRRDRWVQAG